MFKHVIVELCGNDSLHPLRALYMVRKGRWEFLASLGEGYVSECCARVTVEVGDVTKSNRIDHWNHDWGFVTLYLNALLLTARVSRGVVLYLEQHKQDEQLEPAFDDVIPFLTDEQLEQSISIYDQTRDEYYPVLDVKVVTESDVLDPGAVVLVIES